MTKFSRIVCIKNMTKFHIIKIVEFMPKNTDKENHNNKIMI